LSHLPCIQEKDDSKAKSAVEPTLLQRGQSHLPLAATIAIIFKPTSLLALQLPCRIPIQLPHIPFAILPVIQLHSIDKPCPHNPTNHQLSFTTPPNNIPHSQLPNSSTKNRAQPTTTSTIKLRVFVAGHQFPNLRNYPYYHRSHQPEF
jgi:hypothetical protein